MYEDDEGNEKNTTNNNEKAEIFADFFSSVFTKEDIEKFKKKLLELKISKTPGPGGLHPTLHKELATQISQPLELIFELSLKQGKVPQEWKQGEITAIHKKGNRRIARKLLTGKPNVHSVQNHGISS